MDVLYTAKGEEILVDKEDYKYLRKYKWFLTNNRGIPSYPARTKWIKGENKSERVYMHREIMGAGKGEMVDHINRVKTDNRRGNLRKICYSKNEQNKEPYGSSGLKGVSWNKNAGKYSAYISKDGERFHLGYFSDKTEAAKVYDEYAVRLFGGNCYTNFKKREVAKGGR